MNQVLIDVISRVSSHLLTLSTASTSLKFTSLTQEHHNTELMEVRIKFSRLWVGNKFASE
jgi:hypothetical protein